MKTYCFRFWGCKAARREDSSWSSLHRTGLRWAWQGDNDEVLGSDEGDGEDDEVEILGIDDKTTAAVRDFKVRQTSGIIQWFWQNSRLQGQTQPGQRKLQLIENKKVFWMAYISGACAAQLNWFKQFDHYITNYTGGLAIKVWHWTALAILAMFDEVNFCWK